MATSNDVSSQTSDILLEDQVDALRINTFLPRGINRRVNAKENFENESLSKEDIQDKAMSRKTEKGKVSISQPKIRKRIVGPTEEECYTLGRYTKGICMIISNENFHEIHCEKSEIYNIKNKLESKIQNFISTEIEWRPINNVEVNEEQIESTTQFLETLENDDDVQHVYTNLKFGSN